MDIFKKISNEPMMDWTIVNKVDTKKRNTVIKIYY